jgi:hypothetical protein
LSTTAPQRVPRGVADASLTRAFVHDNAGTVLALDLATGAVLWRAGIALRPLAVVDDVVVAAGVGGHGSVGIVRLAADDGRRLGELTTLPVPGFARPALEDSDVFTLSAELEGRSVLLHWTARARYAGGAHADAGTRAAIERETHGAARVDPRSGTVQAVHAGIPAGPGIGDQLPDAPADVLEQRDVGGKRLQLVVRTGGTETAEVLIRAIDPTSGHTLWETVIDDLPNRRPPRLRP